MVDDEIVQAGHKYGAGEVELRGGSAELKLSNGVVIYLSGKTRLDMPGPMNASVSQGTVTFDCPPQAKGYTVQLPGGTDVVDLGTRFTVEVVSEKQNTVRVAEGALRLAPLQLLGRYGPSCDVCIHDLEGGSAADEMWIGNADEGNQLAGRLRAKSRTQSDTETQLAPKFGLAGSGS